MTDKQSAIEAAARLSTTEPWTVRDLASEANVGYQMARHAKDELQRRGLIRYCGRGPGQGGPDLYVYVPQDPKPALEDRVAVLEQRVGEYDQAFALIAKGGGLGLAVPLQT